MGRDHRHDDGELLKAKVLEGRAAEEDLLPPNPTHYEPTPEEEHAEWLIRSNGWHDVGVGGFGLSPHTTSAHSSSTTHYEPTPEEHAAWLTEQALGATTPRPNRAADFEAARLAFVRDVETTIGRVYDAMNAHKLPTHKPPWRVAEYILGVIRVSCGRAYNFKPGGRHSGSRIGVCGAKNPTIAKKLRVSTMTVRRAVGHLVELGLLIQHRSGRGALRVLVPKHPRSQLEIIRDAEAKLRAEMAEARLASPVGLEPTR